MLWWAELQCTSLDSLHRYDNVVVGNAHLCIPKRVAGLDVWRAQMCAHFSLKRQYLPLQMMS